MSEVLTPTQLGADDHEDMVIIRLGSQRPMMPWQVALTLSHHLRSHCKSAARFDRVSAGFWRDVDMEDLDDKPRPHRGYRKSSLMQNFKHWQVADKPPLVALIFDDVWTEMGYEDGVKLHQMIRRAAQRAKAWAGDTNRIRGAYANLTDAEDDYRLGIA